MAQKKMEGLGRRERQQFVFFCQILPEYRTNDQEKDYAFFKDQINIGAEKKASGNFTDKVK